MAGLRRDDALPLIAALPALGLFAWWAADDGGYFAVKWMPGTLALLWLLVALTAAPGGPRRPSRPLLAGLAALAAYTAWSFASIAWARAPGIAFEGSARTLLYLACFATFALLPWTPRAARAALLLFIAAVTVVGAVTLLRATAAQNTLELFLDGRLTAPLGYQNASAALWTIAALPALALAASRSLPLLARAPLLAASGFLLGMAVLAQSRGWLFALPLVALAALAVVRGADRARLVLYAFPVGAAVAAALPRLLDPYDVGGGRPAAEAAGGVHDAMGSAAESLALVAAGLLVVGAVLMWVERRVAERARRSPALSRALRRGGTGLVVVVLAGGVAAGLIATHGDPVGRADTAWEDFRDYEADGGRTGTTRFTDLSSVRYDFWRVGLDAWRDHALVGLGQDNFAEVYVRDRATPLAEARWLHSIQLRALVHTGIIGAALLLAFLVAAALVALRAPAGPRRDAGAVALLPAVVWLVHGSVDWLWEYPALSGPALAFAGIAAGLAQDRAPTNAGFSARQLTAVRAGGIALAVACSAVIFCAYTAELDVRRAISVWPTDSGAAFKRLDRAQTLNPLDAHAALVEGLIASELGRTAHARTAFREAVERYPDGWLAPLQLGLIASAAGERAEAAREFRDARARNPRGTVIAEALRRVNSRNPMTREQARIALARESARQQGRF